MIDFIVWYLILVLTGLLAFPLAFQLFKGLPDRGWALSKPLGLLIWGYAFWLLTTLQLNQNDIGGVLVGLAVMAGLSTWQFVRIGWKTLWNWMKEHRRSILVTEVLFLTAFLLWTIVRAAYPEISSTEKPMEMAFINAILRSPGFPPNDPWLSGYSISYYYFGYILVSMIIRLAGTPPSIGFNLAVALWFALAATASYGILYNLAFGWLKRNGRPVGQAVWNGLLAPFLLLIVSNLEGFFEILHAKGVFWTQAADGTLTSKFWNWLGLLELNNPPSLPLGWVPQRVGGIWWWRASRVVTDTNLAGVVRENIDEFPFFSFYLGDLHPHVLALPFAILAIGLVLNLYLTRAESMLPGRKITDWIRQPGFWLGAITLGAMGFLNTWDFPIYVALAAAAYTLVNYQQDGWSSSRIGDFFKAALTLGIIGGILYLPFYLGFKSQAGGFLPSLSMFSRGIHFWIMFGGMLVPIFAWLFWRWRQEGKSTSRWTGFKVAAWIVFGLWFVSFLLSGLIAVSPQWISILKLDINPVTLPIAQRLVNYASRFFDLHGSTNLGTLVGGSFLERLASPGTWITLLVMLGLTWGLLGRRKAHIENQDVAEEINPHIEQPEETYALLLALVGIGLTLAPEFFYLLDQFGYRMNTIFKFYYQAWLVWSLAGSFALVILWNQRGRLWRVLFRPATTLLILIGLIYPTFALIQRLNLPVKDWNLDALASMATYNPSERQAIDWLRQAPVGVVAEAIGGQYSGFARIATHTGLPTVLGWPGHESQWGRTGSQLGTREQDIESLYQTSAWADAKVILDRYQIRYIYIGDLERNKYRVDETKFTNELKAVFQAGSVAIYEYNPVEGK